MSIHRAEDHKERMIGLEIRNSKRKEFTTEAKNLTRDQLEKEYVSLKLKTLNMIHLVTIEMKKRGIE